MSDVGAWEPFATEILGLQLGERLADGTLLPRMDDNHYRLAVHPGGDDDLAYQGWQVTDEHALTEMIDQLRTAGAAINVGTAEDAAARHVRGLIRFQDPDGFLNEVFYGPRTDYDQPFLSPRGVSGFVTGEQGLGHTNIFAQDIERSVRFYRDVLGLRLSDYIRTAAFLHCNPRHHSLAIGQGPRPKRV